MNFASGIVVMLLALGGGCAALAAEWTVCTKADLLAAMQRSEDRLKSSSEYAMEFRMASYPDPDAAIADEDRGVLLRMGNLVHQNQLGFVTLQNENVCAVADPTERTVVLSDPRPHINGGMAERVNELLHAADRIVTQTTATSETEFRIFFPQGRSPYSHVDIRYGKEGDLMLVLLQWAPTRVDPAASILAPLHSPRVIFELSKPRPLTTAERHRMRGAFNQHLSAQGSALTPLGPWKGFRVVDTRYRP